MSAPIIIVDLIEDEPKKRREFYLERPGQDVSDIELAYRQYLERFQPWRWVAKRAGNNEPLAKSTESYFNKSDCWDAIGLLFGPGSAVVARNGDYETDIRLVK